eukprot:4249856-Amphidinium_carterae.2
MASVFGWMVASADISTAFLHAALHQDDVKLGFTTVYARPPKVLDYWLSTTRDFLETQEVPLRLENFSFGMGMRKRQDHCNT